MPTARAPDGAVEVVIAHHNGVERLAKLLEALEAQTLRADVCVVDDASTDDSAEAIPARFPWLRYVRQERNAGFSATNNVGVRGSAAQLVVLLNNDTVPEPAFVERIVETWRATGAAMVAPCLRQADGTIDSAGIEVDVSLVAYDLLRGEPYDPARIAAQRPLAPSGGAAAFEREAFLGVGGFDEGFFAYLEDVDLGLRMRLAGHECVPVPAFAWHEHSASFGSGTARKNRLMAESRARLLAKYRADLSPGARLRGAAIDATVYLGQVVIDGNAAALRARLSRRTRAAAPASRRHPGFERLPLADIPVRVALARRLGRRR